MSHGVQAQGDWQSPGTPHTKKHQMRANPRARSPAATHRAVSWRSLLRLGTLLKLLLRRELQTQTEQNSMNTHASTHTLRAMLLVHLKVPLYLPFFVGDYTHRVREKAQDELSLI